MPALNTFHSNDEYNKLSREPFTGNPAHEHIKVEAPEDDGQPKVKKEKVQDPLESTEEEEEEEQVGTSLTEIDRLQFHVLAIENDCRLVP